MHKLFREIGITTLGNDTRGELDKEYISFLSNSTNKDTVILTNRETLLRDFSKYKDIFIINSVDMVLELLTDMNNKDIFIDAYINNIVTLSNDMLRRGKDVNYFLKNVKELSLNNKLRIVIINQVYKTTHSGMYMSHLPRTFFYVSNETFIYDSERQKLNCQKSRYLDIEKSSFSMKDWKKTLRLKKIKRILE